MGLLDKIFGSYSEKQIKKITPIVDKIEALADTFYERFCDGMAAISAEIPPAQPDPPTPPETWILERTKNVY